MSRLALGLIETVGLAAAIEAADTAVKSANVILLGYELTKGDGMVLVKLAGDVGAVKAAVEAAAIAASNVSKVVSKQIIPRPHDEIEKLIYSKETVGLEQKEECEPQPLVEAVENEQVFEESNAELEVPEKKSLNEEVEVEAEESPSTDIETQEIEDEVSTAVELEISEDEKKKESLDSTLEKSPRKATCNLCHDPECIRRKGDVRSICLHYSSTKKK